MMIRLLATGCLLLAPLVAQPSFEAPWTPPPLLEREDERRAAYRARINEVFDWRMALFNPDDLKTLDLANMAMMLRRGVHLDAVNARVLAMMAEPGTGPFWMFPVTIVAYTGRDKLSAEARQAIRDMWRTTRQLRGDTENHWVMYYVSLYLISELYPDEPGETWYTGLSSAENWAEARGWLFDWMDITTTIGQGEANATHYIGEYVIPMLMLATWAEDRAMRLRGRMMLDWLFAELAATTLQGFTRGPNSRTDDTTVTERWNALATFFSWLLFGHTPPPAHYGGWGNYFAVLADSYEVPEVLYRIAVDRRGDALQRDRARTRRMWRYSEVLSRPLYKTQYLRADYAVGSYHGGIVGSIQGHVWDVTWAVADPRGAHNTLFSMHPHVSGRIMQKFFATYPEPMVQSVTSEGKPSYVAPDKLLGSSPYEQVLQDQDTIIALYDIPAGEVHPHINGFFSKDLADVVEHASGWIFARGGRAYLAYRPLAPYHWIEHRAYPHSRSTETVPTGGRVLVSPHRRNGTIVQAAGVDEFVSYADFQAAILALPLRYELKPTPTVRFTSLRGQVLEASFGEVPRVDGQLVDYAAWKLFEGTHLNAEVGGRRLVITHDQLERVLDFNALEVRDRVRRGGGLTPAIQSPSDHGKNSR
jgi:hypothetical protein